MHHLNPNHEPLGRACPRLVRRTDPRASVRLTCGCTCRLSWGGLGPGRVPFSCAGIVEVEERACPRVRHLAVATASVVHASFVQRCPAPAHRGSPAFAAIWQPCRECSHAWTLVLLTAAVAVALQCSRIVEEASGSDNSLGCGCMRLSAPNELSD